jgi:transcriptional regulator GlxA family with amidase domain
MRLGMSFTDLRDGVFREVASSLISSGESVEHIAAQMGYSEARSFRRAFRRVFDSSPSEQRHLSAEQQRSAHQ